MVRRTMRMVIGTAAAAGLMVAPVGWGTAARGAAARANDVQELKVTIREWDVPTKGAHPHDPAVGADGALWYTGQLANKIGRLDPATGEFKEYPLKVDNSGPQIGRASCRERVQIAE